MTFAKKNLPNHGISILPHDVSHFVHSYVLHRSPSRDSACSASLWGCPVFEHNSQRDIILACSHMDLAPNFAGTLFGISNTFSGGATGWLAPLFVGLVTQVSRRVSAEQQDS